MSSVPDPERHVGGVGIEVGSQVLRGVRFDGDLSVAGEVPLRGLHDDDDTLDAFWRLHEIIDAGVRPTRLAWFPPGATMQRTEVTDMSDTDLDRLRRDVFEQDGPSTTGVVDSNGRRWLVALGWDATGGRRLVRLAERAGFADVVVEPAPLALHRILPVGSTVARRNVDSESAWTMLFDADLPIIATALPAASRQHPTAVVGSVAVSDPATILDRPAMVAYVNGVVNGPDGRTAMERVDIAAGSSGDGVGYDGEAERACVASGAAFGAAGRSAPASPIGEIVTQLTSAGIDRLAWTVERIDVGDSEPDTLRVVASGGPTAPVRDPTLNTPSVTPGSGPSNADTENVVPGPSWRRMPAPMRGQAWVHPTLAA